MKSIIQSEKICYITGQGGILEEHHVFGGPNRKISEKYGLKIYLTPEYHNASGHSIHADRALREKIQAEVQEKAMEYYGWSIDDFRRIFGKSYLLSKDQDEQLEAQRY